MECRNHPGQEADLVCIECNGPFCRECVIETRESHHCPDCHKKNVERFAAQLSPQKDEKPPKVKEQKPPKEKKEGKKLRKPAEAPLPPGLDDLAPAPPTPAPPEPSLSPEEKAAFWGDALEPAPESPALPVLEITAEPPAPAQPVLEERSIPRPEAPPPARPVPIAKPQAPQPPPDRIVGLPPPISDAPPARKAGKSVKRPLLSKKEREQAVMAAEGFPDGARAEIRAVDDAGDGTDSPRRSGKRAKRAKRATRVPDLPVAMQVPEEYEGELTSDPTYFKAVLFGLLAGMAGAAAYAGVAWWLKKDMGIFSWVIGFGVGLVVVLGSGRHFNWKLGLIAAVIAMFWVSAARIAYFMLDVRFNKIFPMKLGTWPLFRNSWQMFSSRSELLSIWLAFFLIAGAVAFFVAFRPPPVRFELNQAPGASKRVAGRKA